jgi:hypothetical protein
LGTRSVLRKIFEELIQIVEDRGKCSESRT